MDAESWVRDQIQQGRPINAIQQDLEAAGWTDAQIARLFEDVMEQGETGGGRPDQVGLPKQVSRTQIMYAGLFLLTLLLGYGVTLLLMRIL